MAPVWTFTVVYETDDQMRMFLEFIRRTAPRNFELEVREDERVIWRETGNIFARPEPRF